MGKVNKILVWYSFVKVDKNGKVQPDQEEQHEKIHLTINDFFLDKDGCINVFALQVYIEENEKEFEMSYCSVTNIIYLPCLK